MYEKLHGIVLNVIRYNDRHNIAHVYTDAHGMMSFLVAQGVTRGARLRNAMFMPLSLIELEARRMPGRELATMRDVRRYAMLADIYADPVKNAIALFVSELLTRVIHEQERNGALYSYVEQSVILLENLQAGVANFHICFLYHLGAHLGIQPDLDTYRSGRWFDMDNGVFVDNPAARASSAGARRGACDTSAVAHDVCRAAPLPLQPRRAQPRAGHHHCLLPAAQQHHWHPAVARGAEAVVRVITTSLRPRLRRTSLRRSRPTSCLRCCRPTSCVRCPTSRCRTLRPRWLCRSCCLRRSPCWP